MIKKQKIVALLNLGCSKNIIDGEEIAAFMHSFDFTLTDTFEQADIIIVNTCTFIHEATQEAIDSILEMAQLKKDGACSTLIVSGCFSERYRNEVKTQFPEVDAWIGVHNWAEELKQLFGALKNSVYLKKRVISNSAVQYIKISEGCSHRCSFCIIPVIRGLFESRSSESIIKEALWLQEQGVKECIVVSQDTSFYGRDNNSSLLSLLEELIVKTQFPWIRMMYLHPAYVDDALLKLVAAEKRVCSYFDIPLQHIADPVLQNMRRQMCSKDIYSLIERIRKIVADAAIRTSFIVGFPGETEKEFSALLEFIQLARFDKVGVFPFSPEQGTKAFFLRPRPRASTATKRCDTLMEVQRKISREKISLSLGTDQEVIIDNVCTDEGFAFEGRTRADAPEIDGRVFIKKGNCSPGDIITVRIYDADDYDLFAHHASTLK